MGGLLLQLDKYALYRFHVLCLLSQFPEFDAVGDEQRDGDFRPGVLPGVAAEGPAKSPLVAVHAAEIQGHVRHPAISPFQPQG